ncbi:MAG: glycosyltransferase family 2 protein, partial [Proteobacteria bacterium]|nr:glycosyltransferase family 2 protein [Pseudomonadota bacterium]MBU1708804.1 glycosyltransferase family 2 protein [Pseudomonadota bacterium]
MPDKDNQDFRAKILMVIPLYNHGRTVRTVVTRALDAGWPVLVVDDGSTDGGLQTIADLPCETHRLVPNQGKGVAIQAAAKIAAESGYNAIIAVDADNQHDPSEAVLLADAAQEMPAIVIGARRMVQDTVPRASLFGRAFSNFWVRLECGQDLPDTQSGFRLYPVQELLDLKIRSKRYAFEVEVLARAAWAGIPIRSVPVSVHYPPREERASHFHQIKDNFRLTVLHTNLVLRALNPWPHKRLMECPRESVELSKPGVSIFHPVKLLKRICLEHSSAFQLAVAVWMGIFLGALPLIAIHTVVIVYV